MSISIIGAGNMAKGLAARFAKAGHRITLASRDAAKAAVSARDVGNGVSAAPVASVAQSSDIVVLAVPFDAAGDVIEALKTGTRAIARYLEPIAALNITLGFGHGTDIAPTWQRAA